MESAQCLNCDHYNGGWVTGMHCKAYPFGGDPIPSVIFSGKHDHNKAYEGDNGIRYKSSGDLPWVDEDEKEFKKER